MVLLFLESIGTPELLVILVVALVVLGPRRLPELGRKLGKGMSEFRRASDEFKRTWEREVDLDRYTRDIKGDMAAVLPDDGPAATLPASSAERVPVAAEDANSIARGAAAAEFDMAAASSAELSAPPEGANVAAATATAEVPAEASPSKSDWL